MPILMARSTTILPLHKEKQPPAPTARGAGLHDAAVNAAPVYRELQRLDRADDNVQGLSDLAALLIHHRVHIGSLNIAVIQQAINILAGGLNEYLVLGIGIAHDLLHAGIGGRGATQVARRGSAVLQHQGDLGIIGHDEGTGAAQTQHVSAVGELIGSAGDALIGIGSGHLIGVVHKLAGIIVAVAVHLDLVEQGGIYLKYLFLWNNPWINFLWVIVMK